MISWFRLERFGPVGPRVLKSSCGCENRVEATATSSSKLAHLRRLAAGQFEAASVVRDCLLGPVLNLQAVGKLGVKDGKLGSAGHRDFQTVDGFVVLAQNGPKHAHVAIGGGVAW